MKSGCWIWQFPQDYPPPGSSFTHQGRNIPVIGPHDEIVPICDAYVKTHDGVYWMSELYNHTLAPSPITLPKLHAIYTGQGIEFTPWCVPKGLYPGTEAEIACRVLRVTNRLILDVEPYQWFWEGPWSNLHVYMKLIRDAHPNAWIGLSFDPRYGQYGRYNVDKYADIHFDEWLPYVDALLPQDYWETFGVDATWEIIHTAARIGGLGKEIIHCIPGHALPVGFANAVEAILGYEHRLSIWRRGTYSLANAAYVASIQEESEPEDPCADLEAEVARLKERVVGLETTNYRLNTKVVKLETNRYAAKLLARQVVGKLEENLNV